MDDDEATLTHAISGGDYTDVPVPSVEVLVTDDDKTTGRGITVSPTPLYVAAGTSRDLYDQAEHATEGYGEGLAVESDRSQ